MKAAYIIELLKKCDAFSDFHLAVDYLCKENKSVSIMPSQTDSIVKCYCDGEKIKAKEIKLIIRLGEKNEDNLLNKELLERVCDFIRSIGIGVADCDKRIIKTELVSGADLIKDDIHSVQYEIKFLIYYLAKE